MKTNWAADLKEQTVVECVFMVAEAEIKLARDGSPFIKMKLQDKTGAVDAIRWKATERQQQLARQATHLLISGRVVRYQDQLQITVDEMSPAPSELDPSDFLPCSSHPVEEMLDELRKYISGISHSQVRELLNLVTGDTETGRKFQQAPAATRVHHAYLGGLLEHTLSVVKLGDAIAAHYPSINRDLLLAGAILHDVGKVEEYRWDIKFGLTDAGNLVGHITQGVMLVNSLMDTIPDFDPQWRLLITHMIVSHHGQLEYGSPKVPMCREAVALHYIEDMDAKLQIIDREISDPTSIGFSENWTGYVKWLECSLFRGVPGNSNGEVTLKYPDDEEQ